MHFIYICFINFYLQISSPSSMISAFNIISTYKKSCRFHLSRKIGGISDVAEKSQEAHIIRTIMSAIVGENNVDSSKGNNDQMFGRFLIDEKHVFYRSTTNLSAAIVNLRPIVPGHVLVISRRVVSRLSDLTPEEYDDLWRTVRVVQSSLEEGMEYSASNVAIQDGTSAGQSVPHVHVHILPRFGGDFERNDDIYDKIHEWAPTEEITQKKIAEQPKIDVPDDKDRNDRSIEDMSNDATRYNQFINKFSLKSNN